MKILVIAYDTIDKWNEKNGTEISPEDLTDEQFLEIYHDYNIDWSFNSIEAFIKEFNADGAYAPVPSHHYIRAIRTKEDSYPIVSLMRKDLQARGFDTSGVDEKAMRTLAKQMTGEYLVNLFWPSLDKLAEGMGIPKRR